MDGGVRIQRYIAQKDRFGCKRLSNYVMKPQDAGCIHFKYSVYHGIEKENSGCTFNGFAFIEMSLTLKRTVFIW